MTKTAGGSLKRALEENPKRTVLFSNSIDELVELESDCDIIFGHLVYGVHRKLQNDYEYATFVRHPLTRTVSHFYHLLNVDKSDIGKKIQAHGDIDSFFANDTHWEFENFMCKIITGVVREKLPDDDLFQLAVEKIEEEYAFVGVQEMMGLSILLLSQLIDSKINISAKTNIGKYDVSVIARRTLSRILQTNKADLKLYEYVVSKFLGKTSTLESVESPTLSSKLDL